MAPQQRLICASADLVDGGDGVRFEVQLHGRSEPAFVVRHRGRAHAYLNRCAHVPVELDWMPGAFFDAEREMLICATHGATYDPASGHCVRGPCRGARLRPVAVVERDGSVWLEADDEAQALPPRG